MNLEARTYRARAIEAELGLAGNLTEQVAVLFEIIENGQCLGERITWYGYFTDGAFTRTIDSLRYTGWQGEDLANLSTVGSRECAIVLDWESYEGRDYLRVKWVNAGGGGLALKTRMDEAEKRAFAARMRSQVIALGGRTSTAAAPGRATLGSATSGAQRLAAHPNAPAVRPDSPSPGDDDIPF